MTFDELIDTRPNINLGEFINLFLLGYDDKIYIDLYSDKTQDIIFEDVRIISSELGPYYDKKISYLGQCERIEVYIKED